MPQRIVGSLEIHAACVHPAALGDLRATYPASVRRVRADGLVEPWAA